ncbi:MAG: Ni/Fe-hydrogenase cytochrome b subunit [Bryobacteraceae bacterium]|nr:Ni/Fe-hydrogenase cytochrome b subunit [Bryobacteraceae bacterium]
MKLTMPKITFWRVVFAVIMMSGLAATYIRVTQGLAGSSNLSDEFPWGIWIGFDILCGVGLAAGGFTLAAIVHIFNLREYKPVVRPAILTAFLGYSLVVVALMFDLGRPWRIWHPLIMWNPRSVMFEVGWCVTLYTTVLFLEFFPLVLERFKLTKAHKILKGVMPLIIIAGVILSTLHQSSLGSLYLIMKGKLHPLWYSPLMPLLFYISAIAVGLGMTIFESWHSSKAFGRQLEWPLIQKLSRMLAVVLSLYVVMRLFDVTQRHAWVYLEQPGWESKLFMLEMALFIVPALLLYREKTRQNPTGLYITVVMFLLGFVTNRLNISLTGMEASSGVTYIPKWTEVAVTFSIIAGGFAIFRLAAKNLPVFEAAEHEVPAAANGSRGELASVNATGD